MNETADLTTAPAMTDAYLEQQTAFGDSIFRRSKAHKLARTMPAGLVHKWPGQAYDIERSQVIRWLVSQPQLQAYLFERMATGGAIVFDAETGIWRGSDTPEITAKNEGC